ncbi:MAG: cytochrome C assembly family protein [Thiotrichales bacterium]
MAGRDKDRIYDRIRHLFNERLDQTTDLMQTALTLLTVAGYGTTMFLIYQQIRLDKDCSSRLRWVWLVTLIVHGIWVLPLLFTTSGLNLTLTNALSLVSWLVAGLLFITNFKDKMETLALLVFPFIIIALLLETVFPTMREKLVESGSGVEWHVLGSLLAFAILFMAAMQALLLSWLDHRLRNHQLTGWTQHMPPLQYIEKFLYRLIALGFLLLSFSLFTGWMYLDDMFAQHLVHKTVLSMLAWLVFGILLLGRGLAGWRGRTAIRWTQAGFLLLLLSYFGSKVVLDVILKTPTT